MSFFEKFKNPYPLCVYVWRWGFGGRGYPYIRIGLKNDTRLRRYCVCSILSFVLNDQDCSTPNGRIFHTYEFQIQVPKLKDLVI